jgi:hypothetical protein
VVNFQHYRWGFLPTVSTGKVVALENLEAELFGKAHDSSKNKPPLGQLTNRNCHEDNLLTRRAVLVMELKKPRGFMVFPFVN